MLALLGYVGVRLNTLLAPPFLEIAFPPEDFTTSNHILEIAGKTAPGALVEINGRLLPTPPSGEFKRLLVLDRGLTTFTVTARKKYSRPALIERQILILGGDNKISQNNLGGT